MGGGGGAESGRGRWEVGGGEWCSVYVVILGWDTLARLRGGDGWPNAPG